MLMLIKILCFLIILFLKNNNNKINKNINIYMRKLLASQRRRAAEKTNARTDGESPLATAVSAVKLKSKYVL